MVVVMEGIIWECGIPIVEDGVVVVKSWVVAGLRNRVMERKVDQIISMERLITIEGLVRIMSRKKRELLKGNGLIHLIEGIVRIKMLVMKGIYRGRKMLVMAIICQRRGIVMIEKLVVSVRGNIIIKSVNAPGIETEKETGRVIVIEKNEKDMGVVIIVVNTGTNLSMMMSGIEIDHPEDTANHGCLERITIGQDQGMLIMGKEGGLQLNKNVMGRLTLRASPTFWKKKKRKKEDLGESQTLVAEECLSLVKSILQLSLVT